MVVEYKAIIAITDKFLPENYNKKLLEVLSMPHIEEWIREEGKALGMFKRMEEIENHLCSVIG